MADDVALHFGGSGFDGVSARAKVAVRPDAIVDGVGIAGKQLAVGAQQLLSELLDALIELTPEELLDRTLRAGHTSGSYAAESAQLIEAHDFDLSEGLSELLAHDGILRGDAAAARYCAREFDEAIDVALESEDEASAIGSALVHEGADGDVPTVVDFAEDISDWYADVAEEDFVELTLGSHLAERADFDTRRSHVDKENGEALVFRNGGIGADDKLAPIANPAVTGPNFLAVDDVMVAVKA